MPSHYNFGIPKKSGRTLVPQSGRRLRERGILVGDQVAASSRNRQPGIIATNRPRIAPTGRNNVGRFSLHSNTGSGGGGGFGHQGGGGIGQIPQQGFGIVARPGSRFFGAKGVESQLATGQNAYEAMLAEVQRGIEDGQSANDERQRRIQAGVGGFRGRSIEETEKLGNGGA